MSSTALDSSQNLPKKTKKINNVVELYEYAEQQGYDVYWYNLDCDGLESISVMRVSDCKCFIAIDPFTLLSDADELVKGLHEIGHCDTGSFYNEYAACDIRKSMRTVRINEPLNCACPLMIWIKLWLMDIQICGI